MPCPLDEVPAPSECIVERLDARGDLGRELRALGLVPGTTLRVLRRGHGHILVKVEEARYSLGEEVARTVVVRRR
jgi:Fe2+ transport system protein FeoA